MAPDNTQQRQEEENNGQGHMGQFFAPPPTQPIRHNPLPQPVHPPPVQPSSGVWRPQAGPPQQYSHAYQFQPYPIHGERRERSSTEDVVHHQYQARLAAAQPVEPPIALPHRATPQGREYYPHPMSYAHPANPTAPDQAPAPESYKGYHSGSSIRRFPKREEPHESLVGKPDYPESAPLAAERSRFTPDDDRKLKLLKEERRLSWAQIADFFPGRNSGTLQVRYCTKVKAKGPFDWTEELDRKLRHAFADADEEKWRSIATKMGKSNLNGHLCKERWTELSELAVLTADEGAVDRVAVQS